MLIQTPPSAWKDYELIDSGNYEKLERFGPYVMARPEPKALWNKSLTDLEWRHLSHTTFQAGAGFGRAGKEDSGTWKMSKRMADQWTIRYGGEENGSTQGLDFCLRLGLTSFKHVGVFPEQAPNWDFIYNQTRRVAEELKHVPRSLNQTPKVLNLFAYTGAASLAARCAGAEVTHLDSVKQVVTWARNNMELSKLENVRWIVEDALKFVRREVRRGNLYNGLILDPPAYGHGPDGEKWKLDECLYELLHQCSQILAPEHAFMVVNLYSNGYTSVLCDTLVKETFGPAGVRQSGELVLQDRAGRALPLSVFTRLSR